MHHWMPRFASPWIPLTIGGPALSLPHKKRVLCSCKGISKFLGPFALRLCLQHGYDWLRRSIVRLHNQPQKLFHFAQRKPELLSELLTLKDLDDYSKQTATDVSMTTRR